MTGDGSVTTDVAIQSVVGADLYEQNDSTECALSLFTFHSTTVFTFAIKNKRS